MVYLLAVTMVALFGKTGPSILASILSVLAYDFFFVPPFYSFAVSDIEYFFTLLVMLLVTQMISHLTILIRRQAEAAALGERQTSALYTLSRQLANARGVDKLLDIGTRYIAKAFDSEVMALLPNNSHLSIWSNDKIVKTLEPKELGVAQWVYELGQMAGLGTDTLPFSDALYIPLIASQRPIGVLRIRPPQPTHLLTPEQMRLLQSCVSQIASSLEVDRLQEKTNKSELRNEADRIRNTLLQSVSQDLRMPLIEILGSASTLMEVGDTLKGEKIKQLGQDIYTETDQLNRLISNLLQISYLESEEVKLQKQFYSLETLINQIINASSKKLGKRVVHTQIPKDLPKIPFDKILIQEVLINLVDNVIKFTPSETSIEILVLVTVEKNKVMICVEDHGPGIVQDEINKLFEKFYRGRMLTTERGLGLGLAICRKIVEAHGGKIWAENRKEGGAAFRFLLPKT
jgi:two-component system sensor histidine kinase KdpD